MSSYRTVSISLPERTLHRADEIAAADERSRSQTIARMIDQFHAQRSSVTGASRLRDLDALANQHTGDTSPMIDDGTPRPASTANETSSGAPAFGSPYGRATNDEKVIAQNAGRQTPISRDAENANRAHLADHLARTGGKPWGAT